MNVELLFDILAWGLIILGGFFIITGSFGMVRFPDFFSRIHAAGITDSFGAPLILLGVAVHYGFSLITIKIFLLIIFLYLTCPSGTYAIAKSAIFSGYHKHVKNIKEK